MAITTDIMVRFLGDAKGVQSAAGEVEGTGKKLADFGKRAAAGVAAGFAAAQVVSFAKDAVGAASDLSESISKTGVVFGTAAGDVNAWAKDSAKAMGLSQQAALEAAGTYGNLAVSLGLPQQQAADMSKSLVGLAGDLASFNNVPVGDALAALQSGLTGETEPLKKFGVNMNEAALKAQAMAMGLSDGKAPLTATAKAQAAYALIMKQTSTAQGDFARTSDGLANQQRIAAAQTENMKAALGQALLPVIQQLVQVLNTYLLPLLQVLSTFIQENSGWLMPVAGLILGVVVALKAWAVIQAVLNAVLAANPIVLVVIAIAALIAGIILAYQHCETFRAIVDAAFSAVATAFGWITDAAKVVFDWIRTNWPILLAVLTGPFGAAVLVIVKNWDTIKDAGQAVYDWLAGAFQAVANFIMAPFQTAWNVISGVWQNIKDGATAVYDWVKTKFDALVTFVSGILGTITGIASGIANALKAPINAVISAWNNLSISVPTFEIGRVEVAGQTIFPGVTLGGQHWDFPDLPLLAKGGIVTGPTLALLGEGSRSEAVVPLPRTGAFGARTYNLNVNVPESGDPAMTGRVIVNLIRAYERGNGTQWRTAS